VPEEEEEEEEEDLARRATASASLGASTASGGHSLTSLASVPWRLGDSSSERRAME